MKSRTTKRFRSRLKALPEPIRRQAREAYRTFQKNPYHPGLNFKQISSAEGTYSVRISLHYRAVGRRVGDEILWFFIGTHSDYDKLI